MPKITNPAAGTNSFELRWATYDGPAEELAEKNRSSYSGKFAFHEEEYTTVEEAEARGLEVLTADGLVPSAVTIIKWYHQHNLPNALPAVVARSCSMTNYTAEGGELVAKPVDIFARSY
jgi:hypothetical protein